MSKRNSNYSIYSHLRMLLRVFPARDAVAFRLAVAARIEADEGTGQIFPVGDQSPRDRLLNTAGVAKTTNSVDGAMSALRKSGLIRGTRIYSRGERQKGSDRLELNWDKWEEYCVNNDHNACAPLKGDQPPCPPLEGGQHTPLKGGQGVPLKGGQHNKEDGYSNGYSNGDGSNQRLDHLLPSPTVGMADTSNSESSKVGSELQLHEPEVVVPDEGIPWVETKNLPAGYAQGVFFNRRLGKLYLVQGELGLAFYRSLRDDGFSPAAIRAGLTAAGAKAAGVANGPKARGGALQGLVRQYVGYAQEKELQAVARTSGQPGAFQGRPRMFVP